MQDEDRASTDTPAATGTRPGAPAATKDSAAAASCHPDLVCPVCTARGKMVRMQPVKAHYQCPECRYFDSCCM